MSGDILRYPTDTAVTADDFVATEKVSGGRVFRQRVKPEDLKVRATGSQTERSLAAIVLDTPSLADGAADADHWHGARHRRERHRYA